MSHPEIKVVPKARRFRLFRWFRNRLITGLIVAIPIIVVIWAVMTFVRFIDRSVWGVLPDIANPATYLGSNIFGLGLIFAVVFLVMLGSFVSNYVGRSMLRTGEKILDRVPVVSSIYNGLKQIVTTVAQQKERAFRDVCLIEYPKAGIWAIGFVTADLSGAPEAKLGADYVCVFVPTTPNPTSGFLLFAKKTDIILLDMTPEEGAKMIISGGMVSSNEALDEFVAAREAQPLTDETIAAGEEPKGEA